MQVGHRHVELGAFGIFQGKEFGGLVVDFQGGQAQVAADTVVDVHHRRAFAQLGEVLDDGVVVGIGALFAATALHHALAEQRAFGDQGQGWIVQHQAFVERCDGDRQAFFAGDEVWPAVDGFRSQLQTLQQLQQHFASARGLGGKQHASRELVEEVRQCCQRLGGFGFDRQVRQLLSGEAFATAAAFDILLAGDHTWPVLQARKAVFHRQEQLGGWQ
ncbi:hypothetical protein D3C81_1532570 [compost metagenome]